MSLSNLGGFAPVLFQGMQAPQNIVSSFFNGGFFAQISQEKRVALESLLAQAATMEDDALLNRIS